MQLQYHPLADLFPLLEGEEFEELVEDIREYGLHQPVVVYDGMVLDGRNRLRACEEAGVDPSFTEYTGSDPTAYVISLNIKRRHLSNAQKKEIFNTLRETVWPKIEADVGRPNDLPGPSNKQVSDILGTSERTVKRWDSEREGKHPGKRPATDEELRADPVKPAECQAYAASIYSGLESLVEDTYTPEDLAFSLKRYRLTTDMLDLAINRLKEIRDEIG